MKTTSDPEGEQGQLSKPSEVRSIKNEPSKSPSNSRKLAKGTPSVGDSEDGSLKNPVEFREWFKILFREWRPHLSANQFQIVLFIFDRTAGWGKEWEIITNRQFLSGVTGKDGRMYATGLTITRPTLSANLAALLACGAILPRPVCRKTAYAINYEWNPEASPIQPPTPNTDAMGIKIPKSRQNLQTLQTEKPTKRGKPFAPKGENHLPLKGESHFPQIREKENATQKEGLSYGKPGAARTAHALRQGDPLPGFECAAGPDDSPDGMTALDARSQSRRKAKIAAWSADSAGIAWGDACRASHPAAIHIAITKTDGIILHRYGKRWMAASGPRSVRSPAAWLEFLQWVIARWLAIRTAHFAWMKTASPGVPSIRFMVKFSDRFEQAWEDRATLEKMAAMPTRESEIEKRVRRGKDREVAAAEVDERLGLSGERQRIEKAAADLKRQRIAADNDARERERTEMRKAEWRRIREVSKPAASGSFDAWE